MFGHRIFGLWNCENVFASVWARYVSKCGMIRVVEVSNWFTELLDNRLLSCMNRFDNRFVMVISEWNRSIGKASAIN